MTDFEKGVAPLPKFELVEPRSLQEACRFLSEKGTQTKIIAGGTDILVRMKQRLLAPHYLLNIKSIPSMKYILSDSNADLRIGALVTLDEIASSKAILEGWPVLCEAVQRVAAFQHRTRATIGGNVCLDTRCWYYNQALTWRLSRPFCFKMGGHCCHVVKRGTTCFALFSADSVPVLIALGARVKISASEGERVLPLREFYTGEGRSITRLEANELLTEIILPAIPRRCGAVYEKYAMRSSLDFPLVGTAVFISLSEKDDSCSDVRIVFTGVSSGPVEACETGAMLRGAKLTEAAIARAGESAAKEIKIFSSTYCPSDHRRRILEASTQRALTAAFQRARKGSIL